MSDRIKNIGRFIIDDVFNIQMSRHRLRIVKKALDLAELFPHDKYAHTVADKTASFLYDGIGVYNGVRSAETLVKKTKLHFRGELKGVEKAINDLEILDAILGVGNGVTNSFKVGKQIFEWVDLIHLARTGAQLGRIPVTVSYAFGLAGLGIAMASLTVEIGIDCFKYYNLEKKVTHTKDKVTLWQGPIDESFCEHKIAHIRTKLPELQSKINKAQLRVTNSTYRLHDSQGRLNAKKDLLYRSTGPRKAFIWVSYKYHKRIPHVRIVAEKDKYVAALVPLNQKKAANETKIINWTNISTRVKNLTAAEIQQIQNLKDAKETKWNTKKSNLRLEEWKLKLGTAFKVILLSVIITSFVLSFILTPGGVGYLPAMATLAAVSLALAVTGIGLAYYKKLRKPKRVPHVLIPQLAAAAA